MHLYEAFITVDCHLEATTAGQWWGAGGRYSTGAGSSRNPEEETVSDWGWWWKWLKEVGPSTRWGVSGCEVSFSFLWSPPEHQKEPSSCLWSKAEMQYSSGAEHVWLVFGIKLNMWNLKKKKKKKKFDIWKWDFNSYVFVFLHKKIKGSLILQFSHPHFSWKVFFQRNFLPSVLFFHWLP